jgi:hypothetical protein
MTERELLAWAYSKLVYRSFESLEDCLAMDEIKLILMGAYDDQEEAGDLA